MAPRVVVFIDYENAIRSAHESWAEFDEPVYHFLVEPTKLAKRLVKRRAPGGELIGVRVYRGRPDPRKEPMLAGINDRQTYQWTDDSTCTEIFRRPLRYPTDWGEAGCVDRPREKGVDVQLAVDVVTMAIQDRYDVAIIFSRDTDLLPAIEAVRDLNGAHVEAATWKGQSRLRIDGPRPLFCHLLDQDEFDSVRDRRNYLR